MVQRVLIRGGDASAMRVSLPGYDVNSATIDQTCFDSRWSGLVPYLRGQVSSASDAAATVYFGETLAAPPLFLGHFQNTFNGAPITVFANTCTMFRGGGTDQWWYVIVTQSYLQFRAKSGGQVARLTYTLLKRPAG